MNQESEIMTLEKRFWDAMQSKDSAAASQLTAEGCIIVGAQGVSAVDPAAMGKMTKEGKWELKKYAFDKKSVQVRFINEDLAIVGYQVTEDVVVEGKPLTLKANDASVWVREDGDWRCALHTESVAGDPFGRDHH